MVQIMVLRRTSDKPNRKQKWQVHLHVYGALGIDQLTHVPLGKMATISQTIFPDAFSSMKIF